MVPGILDHLVSLADADGVCNVLLKAVSVNKLAPSCMLQILSKPGKNCARKLLSQRLRYITQRSPAQTVVELDLAPVFAAAAEFLNPNLMQLSY